MNRILLIIMVFLAIFGCSKDKKITEVQEEKINIVATIFPCYDFARAVVKDRANLSMLLKPGVEIHSYDPSPADILKIRNADVFIYIGGESEAWVAKVLSSIDTSNKKIVRLIDYVNAVEEVTVEGMQQEEDDGEEVELDEHIWTSPKNAILLVKAINSVISNIDSENTKFYNDNAQAYIAEIENIDKSLEIVVNDSKIKKIVVADRFPFRYLAHEYGLQYSAAFPGCSTESDTSAATMAYLIKTVIDEKLPYIYYVELSNQRVSNAVSEQTGAKPLLLHSAQTVSKADFDSGITYTLIMKQNIENLAKGLK